MARSRRGDVDKLKTILDDFLRILRDGSGKLGRKSFCDEWLSEDTTDNPGLVAG